MKDRILRILLKNYTKIGYKEGIAKVIFDDRFEDIAEEIVKNCSIPDVVMSAPVNQELFNYLSDELGATALESNLFDIAKIVRKDKLACGDCGSEYITFTEH